MLKVNILIVEDNKGHQRLISEAIEVKLANKNFCHIQSVDTTSDAIDCLNRNSFDLLILDLNLKDRENIKGGFEVLERVNKCFPRTAVIVFTGHGSVEICKQAFFNNANEFIEKPKFEPLTETFINMNLIPKILTLLNTLEATRWDRQKNLLRNHSEDCLINNVLIPLLVRMGFQNVEKNTFHGVGELGKDIRPFYSIDAFGERIYYAAQVKSGDVDSTAGSKNSVNKLTEQIDKILITKFFDSIGNIERRVDKALGIISGDFRGESLRIIQDKFEGRNNVLFINGDRILNLLNRYRINNLLLPATFLKLELLEEIETKKNIFIFLQIEGNPSKVQVLEEVSNMLFKKNIIVNKDDVFIPLLNRESYGSTGIGRGIALPHINFSCQKQVFIMCISESGINWESIDGEDSKIICFLIYDDIDTKLKVLAFTSHYFKENNSCKDLFDKQRRKIIFDKISSFSSDNREKMDSGK